MADPVREGPAPSVERRMLALVLAVAAIAAPAIVLRTLCVGRSCPEPEQVSDVPFCSLPKEVRGRITLGFRDGRSPDVLAVAGATPVAGGAGLEAPRWPEAEAGDASRVPLVFSGTGVAAGVDVAEGTTLDAVAPTVSDVVALSRPHPAVRSGKPIEGVAVGAPPRLVLEVVWKGVSSKELEAAPDAWPVLRDLLREGSGTLHANVGSLPLDPAAVLATIGTGGLPSQHGITGTLVRNDAGQVAEAWGAGSPVSVIAGLGDDLDELRDQRPRIGVVGTHPADRGLIGGNWYLTTDRDDVVVTGPRRVAAEAAALLGAGYGTDAVPDLLAVAMEGPIGRLDASLGSLVTTALAVTGRSVAVVVTSSGADAPAGALEAESLRRDAEARMAVDGGIEAMAVGGAFVNRDLIEQGVTTDTVVRALRGLGGPDPILADVFPALAVSFGRYC